MIPESKRIKHILVIFDHEIWRLHLMYLVLNMVLIGLILSPLRAYIELWLLPYRYIRHTVVHDFLFFLRSES